MMDDLAPIRQQLLEERATLSKAGLEDATETVVLDQSRMGRLSRIDAMQMQQMAAAGKRRKQARIQRIDAALTRIEAGEYGDCLGCEEPIAPKRLASDPAATLCIACAEAGE